MVRRSWSELTTDELYDILKLRTDVFFVEQRIDEEELDHRDREPATLHYFIPDEQHGVAAYLRTLVDEQPSHRDARIIVGRVVVHPARRGEGLAQLLFDRVIAEHGDQPMMLHAQEYIVPLYAKYGFEPYGEVYVEAGLPHLSMYRPGA
ncbi:GNAT family N-acetyltransferase [Galbitalea soli]|uniref:GNAT family N-acetyltransferase n=1 Tax=Galbitalea soli TaxID=1268042 RepID=A0A7C9TSN1_9MICO|nr:GNAT family N-acetyltransferase [Galbitalea soli]